MGRIAAFTSPALRRAFVLKSLTRRCCSTPSLDVDWPNEYNAVGFTDADNFEPEEPIKKAAATLDKWEGEDEDEDVKVIRRDLIDRDESFHTC